MAECWPSSFFGYFVDSACREVQVNEHAKAATYYNLQSVHFELVNKHGYMGKYFSAGGKQDTLSREHWPFVPTE